MSPKSKVVLVCGGRDFADAELVHQTLDRHAPTVLIHGGARGADALADAWASARGVQVRRYPADWKKYGLAAGPLRNQRMLNENPDVEVVIAFPGGKGTADMMRRARAGKLPVDEVRP